MPTRLLSPRWQSVGADGRPLAGAKLYTYETGTSTPKPVYSDAALSIAHTHPVIADAAGRFPAMFMTTGDYKIELRDANDVVIATDDPVSGAPSETTLTVLDNTEPLIFNGRFSLWQRGTSVAIAASAAAVSAIYAPDGWAMETGAGQNCTVSRQTGLTTDSQFCARFQRDSGQTGTGALIPQQWIETVHIAQLRGKRLTFGADIRAGSNFSGTLQLVIWVGVGTEGRRPRAGTYTTETLVINETIIPTTTAQRFSVTSGVAVPATTTQMAVAFRWVPSGTAGANDYFEAGRVVVAPNPGIDPPFTSETYELARAQRRFRIMPAGVRCDGYTAAGGAISTFIPHATMRAAPTASGTASSTTNIATGPTYATTADRTLVSATVTAAATASQFVLNAVTLDAEL